jgi:putative ABC transport system permease protein
MLVSLAAILAVNLAGSIDALMTQAKNPLFMQMHSGMQIMHGYYLLAEQNSNVDEFQIIEFLNIDNSKIMIGGKAAFRKCPG